MITHAINLQPTQYLVSPKLTQFQISDRGGVIIGNTRPSTYTAHTEILTWSGTTETYAFSSKT